MFLIDCSLSSSNCSISREHMNLCDQTVQKSFRLSCNADLEKPEIVSKSRQIRLPGFKKAFETCQDAGRDRYMKLVQSKGSVYKVTVTLDLEKKSHVIDVSPLQNIQSNFKVSKNNLLHILSYFFSLNSQLSSCSFSVNCCTQEISLSSGLIFNSKTVLANKIKLKTEDVIQTFDRYIAVLRMHVENKNCFLNQGNIKNEQIQKILPAIEELLFTESEQTYCCKQVIDKDLIVSKKSMQSEITRPVTMTHKIHRMYGIYKKNNQSNTVPNIERQKQLLKSRDVVYDPLNLLCLKVQVFEPEKNHWSGLFSNINSRIEVCDAQVNIENHSETVTRSIVRKIPKTESGMKQIEKSRKIYEKLRNKNCVNLLKSYSSNQIEFKNALITDYCKYRSLSSYLELNKSFISLRNKIYLLLQAAQSLRFLKSQGIVHNDIKPSNFLVASDIWVKLSDFGEAQFVNQKPTGGWTIPYVSPQRLRNQNLDFSFDIYSFGVMTYEILTGKPLFIQRSSSKSQFEKNLKQQNIIFGVNPQSLFEQGPREVMIYLYLLVVRCVSLDKQKRLTIETIVLILKSLIRFMESLVVTSPLLNSNIYSMSK